eukprot:14450887-Alexandrium_andersonii.AAC.1
MTVLTAIDKKHSTRLFEPNLAGLVGHLGTSCSRPCRPHTPMQQAASVVEITPAAGHVGRR